MRATWRPFRDATANAAVVLFDEFDALAKERADEGEHGELRRLVNAVLQMMDAYTGRSVLIPATNPSTRPRPKWPSWSTKVAEGTNPVTVF